MNKFIIVEGCNFIDFPMGGQLTFARQLMMAFGPQVALVGISTDETPVGQWVKKNIEGIEYDFFAYDSRIKSNRKPFVPARLSGYVSLLRHKDNILENRCRNFFIQSHELAVGILNWKQANVCYCFPGIENPLSISRYSWASYFARVFDRWFLSKISIANVILAAADAVAIASLKNRCHGLLSTKTINVFPTRVDTKIFYPGTKSKSREILKLPATNTIIVTTGRIHWAKGWQLLLEAFAIYLLKDSDAKLYFVGDGEDRLKLISVSEQLGIADSVVITGFLPSQTVAEYLRASDVFALASYKEGWSTSLVEALATCLPIITTAVSSSSFLVKNNLNGLIQKERCHVTYASGIEVCLNLDIDMVKEFSKIETIKYSIATLSKDLEELWML
jgi:glycosyltransferase involved in cell wall biosynthesis